jgi:hypothetical protein
MRRSSLEPPPDVAHVEPRVEWLERSEVTTDQLSITAFGSRFRMTLRYEEGEVAAKNPQAD